MLRVLIVAPRYPPEVRTGRTEAFARLAERVSLEAETRCVLGYRRDRALLPSGALGVDLGAAGRVGASLALWRAAREACTSFRPDVVLVSGLSLLPLGRPTVAVVRDLVGKGWSPLDVGPWRRLRARAPTRIVVPTQSVREAVKRLRVDPWRIERIPEGLDVPDQPVPPPPRSDVLRVLHPGTIHPAKGQHVSIDAVSRLPPAVKARVRLVVAGAVHDERYLAQLRVAARGQPIELRPEPVDLAEQVVASDLVVYPTALEEGWPDAAVEALVVGRPVIWPDRASLREVLDGQGIRVPAGDVEALRDALIEAADTELVALGARGQDFARERYGWDRIWPRWRMLLHKVATLR